MLQLYFHAVLPNHNQLEENVSAWERQKKVL